MLTLSVVEVVMQITALLVVTSASMTLGVLLGWCLAIAYGKEDEQCP